MSNIMLSCAETPLAWPSSTTVADIPNSTTSGVQIYSAQPGSLQILTRRQQGGVGDGVNIMESNTVGADYRGQRYSYDEAIFHTQGLHIFPGQTAPYPAEYHVLLETFAEPRRAITLVIPVSHKVQGPGADYFAACSAQPDPAATRPTLSTLLTPGTPIVAYRGPDLRGRTADNPTPETCTTGEERQILLVLSPVQIRASDLERIPREGSLSTDPRDLPALGAAPTTAVARDRLVRTAVYCTPGIKGAVASFEAAPEPTQQKALACSPIKTVGQQNVVDISGQRVALGALLGAGSVAAPPPAASKGEVIRRDSITNVLRHAGIFVASLIGLLLADWLISKLWGVFMKSSVPGQLEKWEKLKIFYILFIAAGAAGWA